MQLALEIAKLELKSRDELQALWREYFKTDCNVQSRDFYIARLAHRMQELAYGGLSTPKKEMIAQIGVGIKKKAPPSGTRIIREYKAVEHSVRILAVQYVCEHCQKLIPEHYKTQMLELRLWQATSASDGLTAGFHLSSLYSPIGWLSWAECVAIYERAKKDAPLMQGF